ncbi:MAG: alpha-ketoacid dehydrogenase subunit beta [Fimbriimonadaceae bacterium]|nr:alpha-ketoacid dehydrogenase subunit beta [Fimbriimonadaceae bacterium]
MPQMYYSHALREALIHEMDRDERVLLIGEDIAAYGGAFKVTSGLLERYGPRRVRDTPISENTLVGLGTGAALMGLRPVVEIMFMDFIALAMDQLVNHAAKFFYMYGQQRPVPLVVRTPAGGGRGYGPTHSQSLEAWLMHSPGLKIACPATPADAKGLLLTAMRDDNPVLFVEGKLLYQEQGEVPAGDCAVPFGQAREARAGSDLTIIAWSRMVGEAVIAADALAAQHGIEAQVLDLRTLVPLDVESIAAAVAATGRAMIVEEGPTTCGVAAEIGFRIFETAFEYLDAPLQRVCGLDAPIPCAGALEQVVLPERSRIASAAYRLANA